MNREPAINHDEQDWIYRPWRHVMCVFKNRTGLGKRVKRAINKRARRRAKREIKNHQPKKGQPS